MQPVLKPAFAAYIDLAAHVAPTLVLVGGTYNFELGKSAQISVNSLPAQKPHIGCNNVEPQGPYVFMLLRLNEPLESFTSCEVTIKKETRVIHWRMLGSRIYSLPQKARTLEEIKRYSEKMRSDLYDMQQQYNRMFETQAPLDFFTPEMA